MPVTRHCRFINQSGPTAFGLNTYLQTFTVTQRDCSAGRKQGQNATMAGGSRRDPTCSGCFNGNSIRLVRKNLLSGQMQATLQTEGNALGKPFKWNEDAERCEPYNVKPRD